ncbi:MAG: hypothetical protein ACE5G9_01010 [Nitrospinales bacterium]
MKTRTRFAAVLGCAAIFALLYTGPVWAQAKGHASVGLGHGEEGLHHLEEMIRHLEFSLNVPDASPQLKTHSAEALNHAREALKHYDEALRHASESLGRPVRRAEGSGGPASGITPDGYLDEGSH